MQKEFGRFDHAEKIFCKSNWQTTKNILDGSIERNISPIMTIDLTNACNFSCPFCIDKSIVREKVNEEIEWDLLMQLLQQARSKGCRCLEISGGGEPTLYSKFSEFIILATQLEYRLALITNGSMLCNYINLLQKAPFDWIRVSLDASNELTHTKVHKTGGKYFDEILSGIEKLVEYHTVGISFLITHENINELYETAVIAKKLHARYFEVKPLTCNYKSSICNFDTEIEAVQNQLLSIRQIEDESFKVFCPASLKKWMEQRKENPKEYSKCLAAYYRSVITPSGVYICPIHRGKNVSQHMPFTADEIIDFRNREIKSIDPSKECCSFCARASINTLLYGIINSVEINPALIDYLGWPVDYGEDIVWI